MNRNKKRRATKEQSKKRKEIAVKMFCLDFRFALNDRKCRRNRLTHQNNEQTTILPKES
jgi:hypothetical protein